MGTVEVLRLVSVVMLIGGAVAAVVGLVTQSRGRYPNLFATGVVVAVFGGVLLLVLFLVGAVG